MSRAINAAKTAEEMNRSGCSVCGESHVVDSGASSAELYEWSVTAKKS